MDATIKFVLTILVGVLAYNLLNPVINPTEPSKEATVETSGLGAIKIVIGYTPDEVEMVYDWSAGRE